MATGKLGHYPLVTSVDDWLKPKSAAALRARAIEVLERAWLRHADGAIAIDASILAIIPSL